MLAFFGTKYALEEVPCGVCGVDTPPIIYSDVESTESEDEERCGPFGLEANGNHDTCNKAENR